MFSLDALLLASSHKQANQEMQQKHSKNRGSNCHVFYAKAVIQICGGDGKG
ncbi:hypothetical protein [Azospirillum endophyticum]